MKSRYVTSQGKRYIRCMGYNTFDHLKIDCKNIARFKQAINKKETLHFCENHFDEYMDEQKPRMIGTITEACNRIFN